MIYKANKTCRTNSELPGDNIDARRCVLDDELDQLRTKMREIGTKNQRLLEHLFRKQDK